MKSLSIFLLSMAACSEDGTSSANIPQLQTAVTTQSIAQPSIASKPLSDFDVWTKRIMQDRISPVVASEQDLSQAWVDAENTAANVVVRVPRTAGKPTVSIAPPSSMGNATPVFQTALAKVRTAGGGILKVAPGDYYFKTTNTEQANLAHILLSKMIDVDIQANGANFIFEKTYDGIYIQDSQRVRISGASMRTAQIYSGTGRMRKVNGVLQLQLDKSLPVGGTINWIQPMNEGPVRSWPHTLSRTIITQDGVQPSRIDDKTFTSPLFNTLSDGQFVAVKFVFYGNRAIYVRDSYKGANEDIVLDTLHIGSIGGMGILIKTRGRGIAIINSSISADANLPFSTAYDGIHLVAAAGDILIRNNSFAHTGDDNLNLRSLIHKVTPTGTDSATLTNDARFIRVGDEVAFFNKLGEYLGRRFVKLAPPIGNTDVVTFDFVAGEPFDEAAFARVINMTPRRFAVVGNTMANSISRGMLIQIPVGLIQNNVISGFPRTAIRLLTSFDPWLEGAGAIDVRITGNTINSGGAELGASYVTGIITALGEVVSGKLAAGVTNGPIKIDNNTFTSPRAPCIAIYNTAGFVQENNSCPGS